MLPMLTPIRPPILPTARPRHPHPLHKRYKIAHPTPLPIRVGLVVPEFCFLVDFSHSCKTKWLAEGACESEILVDVERLTRMIPAFVSVPPRVLWTISLFAVFARFHRGAERSGRSALRRTW